MAGAPRRARHGSTVALAALLLGGLAIALPGRAAPVRAAGPCGDPTQRPWCDGALPADARAGLLLAALTENEKLGLLAGVASSTHTGQSPAIDRVGLRSVAFTDGPWGVKQGPATGVPIPLALAATFDTSLASLHGAVVAGEARDKADDVILAPTVNIMRTPLGGRTFEAYGEDPYLVTRTAVNWIEGAQSQGVIAMVKHYCCNNQEGQYGVLGQKNVVSADIDERTLREIYLPQFEAAVGEAHAGMVMCAYNRVNSDWACENRHLLTDILKGDWRFQGAVVSDWQATHLSALALNNGLDVEMPTAMDYDPRVIRAELAAGVVSQAAIDDHVRRLLRTMFGFGFFDRAPFVDDTARIDVAGHARISQVIEEAGTVLLKNDGVLPLDPARLRSIAVIGPQANRFETGGTADDIIPFTSTTPLHEITRRAGPGVKVTYNDGSNPSSAAAAAAAADVAIVFASDSEGEYMEKACASVDCTTMGKTGTQDSLITTVAAANHNTVVVLETGDPVLTPWRGSIRGLLEAWYPGEEGGAALASVLFGDVDPGGRLPATFPDSESQLPSAGDPTAYPGVTDAIYKEGVFVGYRWYDAHGLTPAYPFGAGLSYTTFRYSGLAVAPTPGAASAAVVRVTVTNTGSRAGVAVPQLYLGLPSPSPSVLQPPRQLRGYEKLTLEPGETRTVSFPLDDRAFAYWDISSSSWRVARGCYRVFLGSSSRDLPLRRALAVGGATGCGAGSVPVTVSAPSAAETAQPALVNTSDIEPTGAAGASAAALAAMLLGGRRRRRRRRVSRERPGATHLAAVKNGGSTLSADPPFGLMSPVG